jgi:hypothetical protein
VVDAIKYCVLIIWTMLCRVASVADVTCALIAVLSSMPKVSPTVVSSTGLAIILGVTIGGGVLLVVVIAVTVAVVCHRMKGSKLK